MARIVEETWTGKTQQYDNGRFGYYDHQSGKTGEGHTPDAAKADARWQAQSEANARQQQSTPQSDPLSGTGGIISFVSTMVIRVARALLDAIVKPVPATIFVAFAAAIWFALGYVGDPLFRGILRFFAVVWTINLFGRYVTRIEYMEGHFIDALNGRSHLLALLVHYGLYLYSAAASWFLTGVGIAAFRSGNTKPGWEILLVPTVVAIAVIYRRAYSHPTLHKPIKYAG